MFSRQVFAVCLAAVSASASAQHVEAIDVLWSGTYDVGETKEIEDPSSPMGRRFIAGGIEPLLEAHRIPATLGTRFGVGFVPRGEPQGARAPVHALWRFPDRGLHNPETRATTFEWKIALESCTIGRSPYCLIGYPLRHPWELVPGRWTLEIWSGARKLAERSFELYLP